MLLLSDEYLRTCSPRLLREQVLPHKNADDPKTAHHEIEIKPISVELDEDGVRISLTIVDTPGVSR
jgi:cell division control protein 11